MKKFIALLPKLLFGIFLTFVFLEIGLRIFPGVIPLDLLIRFHETPREKIAHQRGLPTKGDTVLLSRDDGGPELRVFKPATQLTTVVEEDGSTVTVQVDEVGFCNPPENSYQLSKIDIITLGDSFTFCHAVYPPQAWTSKLSSLTGYSAYNLGRVGVGIHEYLQIFKKFGVQKSPQVVIMNIYEGNDLRDARNYYFFTQRQIGQDEDEASTVDLADKFLADEFLGRYSYAFNLALSAVEYGNKLYSEASKTSESSRTRTNFKYQLVFPDGTIVPFNLKDTDKDEVRHAARLRDKAMEIEVSLVVMDALRSFVELSEAYNFIPVVTYTPSAHTAYAANVEFEDPALQELMPWASQEQREFISAAGDELGFTFIDLTPAIQQAAQSNGSQELLYYKYDLHLTPAGHTVVAEALSQELQNLGVIETIAR